MVTDIALPAATSKMGAERGVREILTANKELRLFAAVKYRTSRSMINPNSIPTRRSVQFFDEGVRLNRC
jgi:hypothetical protein